MVAEYAGTTLSRRYVHGAGADIPLLSYDGATLANPRFLHADRQGSIVAVSDGAGGSLTINRYDEYGIPAASNVGRFQYTGQIWLAELGMYHYKARMYSPTLGRMMQTDPVGYEDQFNLYAYVGNDPVNHVDPTGETGCEVRTGSRICERTATRTILERKGNELRTHRITYFQRDGQVINTSYTSEGIGDSYADPTILIGGIGAGIRALLSRVVGRGGEAAAATGGALAISAATRFSAAEASGLRGLMGGGEAGARAFLARTLAGEVRRLPEGVTRATLMHYIIRVITAGPRTYGAPVHQMRIQAILKILERMP